MDKVDYVSVQCYVPFDDERSVVICDAPIAGAQSCPYPFESIFVHGDGLAVPFMTNLCVRFGILKECKI